MIKVMMLVADTTRRRGKTALPIYGIALVQVQNLTLALVSALRSDRRFDVRYAGPLDPLVEWFPRRISVLAAGISSAIV